MIMRIHGSFPIFSLGRMVAPSGWGVTLKKERVYESSTTSITKGSL